MYSLLTSCIIFFLKEETVPWSLVPEVHPPRHETSKPQKSCHFTAVRVGCRQESPAEN